MNYILPFSVFIVCLFSLFLLLREFTDSDSTETSKENSIGSTGGKFPQSLVLYSALSVVLTLILSLILPRIYPSNEFWTSLKCLVLLSVMWPMAYVDFKTMRIPNTMLIWGIVCRAIIFCAEYIWQNPSIWISFRAEWIAAGALLVAGILSSLITHNGIGSGDLKLFFLMGLMLGLKGIWSAIMLALAAAAVYSLYLILFQKKNLKCAFPFAPFLVFGSYLSVFLTGM